jgi:hypothetical protein
MMQGREKGRKRRRERRELGRKRLRMSQVLWI